MQSSREPLRPIPKLPRCRLRCRARDLELLSERALAEITICNAVEPVDSRLFDLAMKRAAVRLEVTCRQATLLVSTWHELKIDDSPHSPIGVGIELHSRKVSDLLSRFNG